MKYIAQVRFFSILKQVKERKEDKGDLEREKEKKEVRTKFYFLVGYSIPSPFPFKPPLPFYFEESHFDICNKTNQHDGFNDKSRPSIHELLSFA